MSTTDELFPTIGQVVNQTDQIKLNQTQATDDEEEKAVTEISSLCLECHEQGTTRLLLTSIPFFREIVVMSFRCGHCGAQNNEIQAAATIQPEGGIYTTRILDRSDLDRQLVRSATCEITIAELELTLPPTSRGQLTTVEGLIRDITSDLNIGQPLRRIENPENYQAVQNIINKLKDILDEKDDKEAEAEVSESKKEQDTSMLLPFTIILDDPAGNSFIEFIGNMGDPKWNKKNYHRTFEQNITLGLVNPEELSTPRAANPESMDVQDINDDEVFVFPGKCSSCGHSIETKMKKVIIPYFKDIFIMSTNCDKCGYRDNEIKSGGAISEKGKRITVKVEDREDLSRDILKSETAGLEIPEVNLVLSHGTLGGRFTTLEGILQQVHEELKEKVFMSGDSSNAKDKAAFAAFLENLEQVREIDPLSAF
ncbi:nucleolar zinc-finger protein [Leucoagaricus gongylophorus]